MIRLLFLNPLPYCVGNMETASVARLVGSTPLKDLTIAFSVSVILDCCSICADQY